MCRISPVIPGEVYPKTRPVYHGFYDRGRSLLGHGSRGQTFDNPGVFSILGNLTSQDDATLVVIAVN